MLMSRWYTNVEKHLPGLYEPVTATVCDSMVMLDGRLGPDVVTIVLGPVPLQL